MSNLYDTDIVAWASEQAELLRSGQWSRLDIDNIAGEIEDVGKSEKRELASRLAVLIGHLLRWQLQPERRSKSWTDMIDVQRARVEDCLHATPSLKHLLEDDGWLQEIWHDGLHRAQTETELHGLPRQPIWSVSELRDPEFLPS